eukprot:gene8175-biopygen74
MPSCLARSAPQCYAKGSGNCHPTSTTAVATGRYLTVFQNSVSAFPPSSWELKAERVTEATAAGRGAEAGWHRRQMRLGPGHAPPCHTMPSQLVAMHNPDMSSHAIPCLQASHNKARQNPTRSNHCSSIVVSPQQPMPDNTCPSQISPRPAALRAPDGKVPPLPNAVCYRDEARCCCQANLVEKRKHCFGKRTNTFPSQRQLLKLGGSFRFLWHNIEVQIWPNTRAYVDVCRAARSENDRKMTKYDAPGTWRNLRQISAPCKPPTRTPRVTLPETRSLNKHEHANHGGGPHVAYRKGESAPNTPAPPVACEPVGTNIPHRRPLEPGSLREPTPHGHDAMSVSGDFSRVARAS